MVKTKREGGEGRARKKTRRGRNKKRGRKEKKKEKRAIKVKRVIEKWEIQKEEVIRSEKDMKKLIPPRFHKQIKVFGKKVSERMLVKMCDHVIKLKNVINLSLQSQTKEQTLILE